MGIIYLLFALMLMLAGAALWLYVRAIEQDGMVVETGANAGAVIPTRTAAPARPPVSQPVQPVAHNGFDDEDGGGGVISPERMAAWAALDEESAAAPRRPSQAANLYEVLGVEQDADEAALRAAYRSLAKQWHTDTNQDPRAADEFNLVREAYDVLSDSELREKYDAGLEMEGALQL